VTKVRAAAPPRPTRPTHAEGATGYAWLVLALTFGLLLSDYMSRQLLSAVFPLLKIEWVSRQARS
jgi:hypothetical protein